MNWENIIKATEEKPLGYTAPDYDIKDNAGMKRQKFESNAVRKLTGDEFGLYDMGHNEISSLNNYFKDLIKNDGKYDRDEHHEEYTTILELSEKLEVTLDNLEDYLSEARELLRDIGL